MIGSNLDFCISKSLDVVSWEVGGSKGGRVKDGIPIFCGRKGQILSHAAGQDTEI